MYWGDSNDRWILRFYKNMSLPSELSWFPFGELGEIGDVELWVADVVPQSIITFSFNFCIFIQKNKYVLRI